MREKRPKKRAPKLDTARALERLRGMLKEKGLNISAVREAIALAALEFDGHFDINDLVRVLGDAGVTGAHLTTVYRTLPLLIEAGIIKPAVVFSGERVLYEAAFERDHHDHLVCTACGTIVEFHMEAIEALQRDIASRYGFELTSHVHELMGRCESCRREDRAAAPPELAQRKPATAQRKPERTPRAKEKRHA